MLVYDALLYKVIGTSLTFYKPDMSCDSFVQWTEDHVQIVGASV